MSGERPADPYTHWRRRAEAAEAEVARLNMEMEAYRQNLTPKDAEAMTAVIKALNEEKDRRSIASDALYCPTCLRGIERSQSDGGVNDVR